MTIQFRIRWQSSDSGNALRPVPISAEDWQQIAKSAPECTLKQIEKLNLTTRQDLSGRVSKSARTEFAWRHFSFCEWFAGLHLAAQTADEQSRILQQHALDERWRWIIRFALSAAQRQKQARVVTHLAAAHCWKPEPHSCCGRPSSRIA
ncbi:MAG UNVERIFIED_CONTAM: hypothetical protein LVR18_27160 [Planctomycetaceae bacterium]|jgi:hypothetical protein